MCNAGHLRFLDVDRTLVSTGANMKRLVVVLAFASLISHVIPAHATQRFGRPVVSLESPKDYQYFRLDDVNFPMLSSQNFSVSCLVYRGTERYYLEIAIQNQSPNPVALPADLVEFTKPGYTVYRTNTDDVAMQLAGSAGLRFVPTPPPQMPANSTTTTTVNANATTYGNMTQVNGSATSTTRDTSGQAGANFGSAIGNAIAARRFYNAQRQEASLAQYLTTYGWKDSPRLVQPGKVELVMMTFQQAKRKKAHFQVVIHVGGEGFSFKYRE